MVPLHERESETVAARVPEHQVLLRHPLDAFSREPAVVAGLPVELLPIGSAR